MEEIQTFLDFPPMQRGEFDDGGVWQRDIGPPPPVVVRRAPVAYYAR